MNKAALNKRHRTYLPEKAILYCLSNGIGRDAAFFVKLKAACSHGYFLSIRQAAQRTNTPRSTVGLHLKKLVQHGFVKKTSEGYFLLTRTEIDQRFKLITKSGKKHCCTIIHKTNETTTDIEYALRQKLTEYFSRQQQKCLKDFILIEKQKKGATQALRKFQGNFELAKQRRIEKLRHKSLMTNTGFTYQWLAEKTFCSKSKAFMVMRKAKELGKCRAKVLSEQLCCLSLQQWERDKNFIRELYPTAFFSNGQCRYNVCTLFKEIKYWERQLPNVNVQSIV